MLERGGKATEKREVIDMAPIFVSEGTTGQKKVSTRAGKKSSRIGWRGEKEKGRGHWNLRHECYEKWGERGGGGEIAAV